MAEKNNNINTASDDKIVEKAEKKSTKKQDKKPNFLVRACKRIAKFFKDTVGELKKVVWTSKTEVWKSFKLVIATVVAISALIAVIDYVSSLIINSIAGLIG